MTDTNPTPNDAANAAQGGTQAVANTVQELPQWAQTKISEANAEAARYRVERNEAVETAKAALQAEFDEKLTASAAETEVVRNDLSQAQLETSKLKAALEAGIPASSVLQVAELLKGDDEAALRSHASELKKLFGTTETQPPIDPSQGSGGTNHLPLNGDPLLAAITKAVGA